MSQGKEQKIDLDFELLSETKFDLAEVENVVEQGIEISPGVEYGGTKQLAQEKIKARMELLAMPPSEAQKLVDMTLYPQYWSLRLENLKWSETIPSHYGEDDDAKATDS